VNLKPTKVGAPPRLHRAVRFVSDFSLHPAPSD
jgi:hypothetical protein